MSEFIVGRTDISIHHMSSWQEMNQGLQKNQGALVCWSGRVYGEEIVENKPAEPSG